MSCLGLGWGGVAARNMAEFHEISGYEVLSTLGQGARSTIYEVRDKAGDLYALKRVVRVSPADQRFLDQALAEHVIASKFDHPLLRKSYKVIRNRALIRVTEVLVLMERVVGKSLEQHRPSDMFDLCAIIQKTAQGLAAMHEAGYVHADIKPNNIMVTGKRESKIIDFGQSCEIGTVKERIQGTPDYIAPEQVLRRAITPATDAFNLGATMYWLLTGKHVPTLIPRTTSQVGQVRDQSVALRHDQLLSPDQINSEVPPALSNLVMECVRRDPKERPGSMQAIADRFEIVGAQILRARERNGGSDGLVEAHRSAS